RRPPPRGGRLRGALLQQERALGDGGGAGAGRRPALRRRSGGAGPRVLAGAGQAVGHRLRRRHQGPDAEDGSGSARDPRPAPLRQAGQPVRLHTYTYVREDALALFGFLSVEELAFFKLLLSVKGIGPKAGLAIIGRGELRILKRAILQEDAALLATVPGIGAKTAARVVLEL